MASLPDWKGTDDGKAQREPDNRDRHCRLRDSIGIRELNRKRIEINRFIGYPQRKSNDVDLESVGMLQPARAPVELIEGLNDAVPASEIPS